MLRALHAGTPCAACAGHAASFVERGWKWSSASPRKNSCCAERPPGTIDHKLYLRGVGTVLEQTIRGGSERAALVSVTK
jgi:hypothetical protein